MDLEDFDFEVAEDDSLVYSQPPLGDYLSRKVENIEKDPVGSKWLIADAFDLCDNLDRTGELTAEQTAIVDQYIADNYKP